MVSSIPGINRVSLPIVEGVRLDARLRNRLAVRDPAVATRAINALIRRAVARSHWLPAPSAFMPFDPSAG